MIAMVKFYGFGDFDDTAPSIGDINQDVVYEDVLERRRTMKKADEIAVEVKASLTISDKAVDRCLRLLEMWLDDNPDNTIVCDRVGDRHRLSIHRYLNAESETKKREKGADRDMVVGSCHGETWVRCHLCGKEYETYSSKDGYCPHCNGYGIKEENK